MNKTFQNMMGQTLERLMSLSLNQKVALGTLIIGLVLSTAFVFQKNNDDFDVLYDNMSLPDAAAAVEKLRSMHESYRVVNGGHTVLVPRQKKNDLVLATASELTSEETINLSKIPPVLQGDVQKEWIKKLNTQEIESVLTSIEGIKNARVIVTQPEYSVFSEEQQNVTASVMLVVNPGFRLHADRVKVIKNLVAHAVPGLTVENVAIADNLGNSLSDSSGVLVSGQSESELRQKTFEEKVTRKVLSILTPVVGKANAVVSVSATLNFDQAESEVDRVIPSSGTDEKPTGLAVSEQVDLEEYSGGDKKNAAAGGEPGTQSNAAPKYEGSLEGGDKDKKNNYKHTKSTTNFANSSEHKKVIHAAGSVERLTVAVVLNKVLTSSETEEIKQLVESAAGVDAARGDTVEIKGFQFSEPLANNEKQLLQAAESTQSQNFYLQLASVIGMTILGFVALFVFYLLFKRSASEGELVGASGDDYGHYIAGGGREPGALMSGEDSDEPIFAALETRMEPEMEHMKNSIAKLVEADPDEAARVILTYMKDI
jgi:flagellar M-ring protein FliF